MRRKITPHEQRFWILVPTIGVVLMLLDRLTKVWALRLDEAIVLITGQLELSLLGNAHWLFYWKAPELVILSGMLVALVGVIALWWNQYQQGNWQAAGWTSLVLIGALSNFFDRLWYGLVIDFIRIPWWSVFNLADVYIVVGVLVLLRILWHNKATSSPAH